MARRAVVIIVASLAVTGCSSERPAGNEVDVNAAAQEAQNDIRNYAASGHPRAHRPVVPKVGQPGDKPPR